MSDKEPNDINVNVSFGRKQNLIQNKEASQKRKRLGRRIGKLLLILIVIIVCGGIIIYALTPNRIVSFTQYSTNDDGQPIEMRYSFGEESASITHRNAATGKTTRISVWREERILFFNHAKQSMIFLGEEYASRAAVLAAADEARSSGNVSRKSIEMTKGQTFYSSSLTRTELAWLKFHPEDMSYFRFSERTNRQ